MAITLKCLLLLHTIFVLLLLLLARRGAILVEAADVPLCSIALVWSRSS